ncbi:MAG: LysR family transcriptional regulator [Pelistega sp.]|nr:LysR family transcriptional regulator [Pelistega sp.]
MVNWDDLRYFLEVARTQRVSTAGVRLGVEHTTVARRIRQLENELNTVLFEKSRGLGFTLTQAGIDLLRHVEKMESHLLSATEEVSSLGDSLSGNLKIAATEGFGSFVLTPVAMHFQELYPGISLDVMPFQRYVSHSKRETDIVIGIERPARGPYIGSKLTDYALKLYATHEYIEKSAALNKLSDLSQHRFISYIDELIISDQLRYVDDIIPRDRIVFRSNSVVAQMRACLQGKAMAILPCFLAESQPLLTPVLEQACTIQRSFWMHYHEDLKSLKRIDVFTQYMKQVMEQNKGFMLGNAKQLKI